MKKVLLMSVLAMCLAGCTPDERIAALQTQAQQAEKVVTSIDAVLPALEQGIADAKAVLADPQIDAGVKEKLLSALETAEAEAGKYRGIRDEVLVNLKTLNTAIAAIQAGGDATIGQELELYGEILKTGSKYTPPQYSGYVYLGGLLITLIGGIFGGKKAQDAVTAGVVADAHNDAAAAVAESDAAQSVVEDVVKSVDKLLATLKTTTTPEVVAAAKEALRSQSPDTQAEVKRIKASE